MSSLLKSTRNTRALPTGTMRYIRSDAPTNLTEEEIQWLLDNNITAVIDLGSEEVDIEIIIPHTENISRLLEQI